MNKLYLLIGIAIGYVLGARAGRERYEAIRAKGQDVWNSDAVQDKVTGATEAVKAKAPVVGEKVADAAKSATETAKEKASGSTGTSNEGLSATLPTT